MQTPLQIDFQGLDVKSEIRTAVVKYVAQLERRFGRVIAGRVVLKGPGDRRRTGGLYEIKVRLALPEGREVNIGHVRQDDERYSDLGFALNDTFKRARRQLQDQVRIMRGEVKHHEGA